MKTKFTVKGILLLSIFFTLGTISGCTDQTSMEDYQVADSGVFSYDSAAVYFAMTDRFYDGNPDNNTSYGREPVDALGKDIATFHGGDFAGLTEKLEEGYFQNLGVDVLWVSAPYEQIHGFIGGGSRGDFAHYGFHGYYALDWTMMDRNFGTVEEFRTFVNTAHAQEIRVFLDVVMNHVGYPNMQDMLDYDYGGIAGDTDPEALLPEEGEDFHKWTGAVDWEDPDAWEDWWGDWVRGKLPGYHPPGDTVYTQNLYGLPDIRTEVTEDIGLPGILQSKWDIEQDPAYEPWKIPAARELRRDLGIPPAEYLSRWLASWVEEFGINGFRIDTARHVEIERWEELKERSSEALQTFRRENPEEPGALFEEDFFFLGEVWGHGLNRNYYYDHGFDALINFTFQGERRDGPAYFPDRMPRIFENYSASINEVENFTVLSYLSQHDTSLYPRDRLEEGGTYLMLLPGMVKIFYGDEAAREAGEGGSDATMGTRSSMDWEALDEDVLQHFQKLGQFRNRNRSVGGGHHTTLSREPFIFTRTFEEPGQNNRVMVYLGEEERITLPVGEVFQKGEILRDAYQNRIYEVNGDTLEVDAGEKGIVLLEVVQKVE